MLSFGYSGKNPADFSATNHSPNVVHHLTETMKLKSTFGNTIKNEIRDLANNILNDKWKGRISSTEIESAGILDCQEIISEFLEQNEFGCAFEHLTYVVSETETNLTTEQANKINQLNEKLNS